MRREVLSAGCYLGVRGPVNHDRRPQVGAAAENNGSQKPRDGSLLPVPWAVVCSPGDETHEAHAAHPCPRETLGTRGRFVVVTGEKRTGERQHESERVPRAMDDRQSETVVALENESESAEGSVGGDEEINVDRTDDPAPSRRVDSGDIESVDYDGSVLTSCSREKGGREQRLGMRGTASKNDEGKDNEDGEGTVHGNLLEPGLLKPV